MKKTLALVCLMLMLLPGIARAENLILNGGFEELGDDGLPVYWEHSAWMAGVDYTMYAVSNVSNAGQNAALIVSDKPNDARFIQTVPVEPNTTYQISCMVRAEGIDPEKSGAGISVQDTFVSSEYAYDTGNGWVKLVLTGTTGEHQSEMSVMARVGGYGSLNTGSAWFDEFSMERVENAMLDEVPVSFATLPPANAEAGHEADSATEGLLPRFGDIAFLLVLGALFVLLCMLMLMGVGRGGLDLNQKGGTGRDKLFWILMIALLVRLILSALVRGYGVDMTDFELWGERVALVGPDRFYAPDYFCDYPPGYLYVLGALEGLRELLRIPFDSQLHWVLIKLVPVALDILGAALLFKVAKKLTGQTTALMLAAFYAFNPAAILNSAGWGQIDAVLATLLMLSIYLVMKGKWIWALPVFGVAVLMKPQALMFGPLGLLAAVMAVVNSENRGKALRQVLLGILLMLAVMAGMCLPFVSSLNPGYATDPDFMTVNPLFWVIRLFGQTLSSYSYLSVNACNVWTLLDMNWSAIDENMTLGIFGWLMMGLSYVYAGYLYLRSKDVNKLPLVCALALTLIFCLGPKMHERYLFPVLLLLLFAYMEDMDVRLLIGFVVLSFTQFINAALVLRSDHLQSSEQILNAAISLLNLLSAGLLSWTGWDLCARSRSIVITRVYQSPGQRPSPAQEMRRGRFIDNTFKPRDYRLNMRLRDWALMLVLTGLSAVLLLTGLGDRVAPVTEWTSSAPGEQVTFDLGEVQPFHMAYYGGISDVNFKVQVSDDNEVWSKEYYALYNDGQVFRWMWYRPHVEDPDSDEGYSPLEGDDAGTGGEYGEFPLITARYIRLTMSARGASLFEVAFQGPDGAVLPISAIHTAGARSEGAKDAKLLIDEQNTVPLKPSYMSGTYFDEIYHARTAYENIHGLHSLEYTHPPLGKLLIAVGIQLFGMNPFGWRFMGALFGILMVPLMYLLAKQLLKRSSFAFIASFLMAVDCMHFTQTRIATIDSFAVFFIMLMYLFMLRYMQMSFYHQKLWRTLIPLGLCGITMGLGIATKWIDIYAAAGLAVLFFISLGTRYREHRYVRAHMPDFEDGRKRIATRVSRQFGNNTSVTLVWCVMFFLVIPALIYYFSYYWQLTPDGAFNLPGVWKTQLSMFSYHRGLSYDTHLFKSPWYQWPVIAWPMWYYTGRDYLQSSIVSSISCMGNPVVFWGGFVAMVIVLGRLAWHALAGVINALARFLSGAEVLPQGTLDRRWMFVGLAFLSQYLPWVLVPRSTFMYHYFASVPFIILATALMFEWMRKKSVLAFKLTSMIYCVAALLLFAFFYPICSGIEIPRWYAQNLRWFHWINYN